MWIKTFLPHAIFSYLSWFMSSARFRYQFILKILDVIINLKQSSLFDPYTFGSWQSLWFEFHHSLKVFIRYACFRLELRKIYIWKIQFIPNLISLKDISLFLLLLDVVVILTLYKNMVSNQGVYIVRSGFFKFLDVQTSERQHNVSRNLMGLCLWSFLNSFGMPNIWGHCYILKKFHFFHLGFFLFQECKLLIFLDDAQFYAFGGQPEISVFSSI